MRKKYRTIVETAIAATAESSAVMIERGAREIAAIIDDSNKRLDAQTGATKAALDKLGSNINEADPAEIAELFSPAGFIANVSDTEVAVEDVRRATGQAVLESLVAAAPGLRLDDAQKGAQAAVNELDKIVMALLTAGDAQAPR